MNKKKLLFYIIIIALIIVALWFTLRTKEDEEFILNQDEYVPVEEIGEEELRTTVLTLYFKDKESNELMPETRIIDAKVLLESPYQTIINFLISGPKSESLDALIPEGVTINNISMEDGTLHVDFGEEFEKENELAVRSIISTLTILKEVNNVKVSVNGEELTF